MPNPWTEDEYEGFEKFRDSPFNHEGGRGFSPFLTGVDYVGPMVDNPEPEGFLGEEVVGADQIIPGSITPAALDTTPPAVPNGLVLTNSSVTMPDGTSRPTILARWNEVSDTDLDNYEIDFDKAYIGFINFVASASGTGGSLPAGTYRVQVTALAAVNGETAAAAAVEVPVTAGQRLFVTIIPVPGMVNYKVYASRDDFAKFALTTAVTGSAVEITAEGTGAVAPTTTTALTFLNPIQTSATLGAVEIESVSANLTYGARVRSRDVLGNKSAWSTLATVISAKDSVAPLVPTGLTAVPGFRLVGLTWQRSGELDLAYYQVRFSRDDPLNPGFADPAGWVLIQTLSNRLIISDLDPAVTYHFQVRAVDRSDNVRTTEVDPTPVSATGSPAAGWSAEVVQAPSLIGASDIAANTVNANHITTAGLDASILTAGQLRVGVPGSPSGFLIYDSAGVEIGRWDNGGLVVVNPANTDQVVRVLNGVLEFSQDGGTTWTTALSGAGIRADAITLGTAPGGHNNLPNSGFELAAFVTSLAKVWTSAADWGTTIGTDVNITKTGTELRQTTFTF